MKNSQPDEFLTLLKVAIRYFMLSSKPFSKDVKEQRELGKLEKELEKLTKVRKSNAEKTVSRKQDKKQGPRSGSRQGARQGAERRPD